MKLYLTAVKTMTNFERIKQMSVDEMASYFCIGGLPICPLHAPRCKDNKCPECFKKWLESDVEENEEENAAIEVFD